MKKTYIKAKSVGEQHYILPPKSFGIVDWWRSMACIISLFQIQKNHQSRILNLKRINILPMLRLLQFYHLQLI